MTTHYAELKEWASATDGVANAATGFDPETHAPLYRIALGRPGISHALQTAERLGLDAEVVADARGRVAPERLRIEELLAEAEAAERTAVEEREAAAGERAEAAELRASVHERASRSSRPRSRRCARPPRPSESAPRPRHCATWRTRARSSMRFGTRSGWRGGSGATSRSATAGSGRPRSEPCGRNARSVRSTSRCRRPGRSRPATPSRLRRSACTERSPRSRGTRRRCVGAAGHRLRIPLARLRPSRRREAEAETPVKVVAAARSDMTDELDVRGQRAQEAREAVRAFVDDAALAGLASVRVIHGRATGAVRAAVRDELDKHPLVDSRDSDSADGATVAHLNG